MYLSSICVPPVRSFLGLYFQVFLCDRRREAGESTPVALSSWLCRAFSSFWRWLDGDDRKQSGTSGVPRSVLVSFCAVITNTSGGFLPPRWSGEPIKGKRRLFREQVM